MWDYGKKAEEEEKVINCGILLIHATTRIRKYKKRYRIP